MCKVYVFRVEELRDSTAHAEMICIREASNVLRTWRLAVMELFPRFIYAIFILSTISLYITCSFHLLVKCIE